MVVGTIISAGLYGSGSTWLFNVLRLLVSSRGYDKVTSAYSDFPSDSWPLHPRSPIEQLIIKTHKPPNFLIEAAKRGTSVIVTVRDPRDCVASLMTRFLYDLDTASNIVVQSANRILLLKSVCDPLIFRYEDNFIGRRTTISSICELLELSIDENVRDDVLADLSAENVRARINKQIEEGTLDASSPKDSFELDSHWHPGHIGDQQIGKYRKVLTSCEADRICARTAEFMKEFCY